MNHIKALEKELLPDIRRILEHPFLKRIASTSLSEEQLQYFAIQYNYYCQAFPRFLCAVAANIPNDEYRMPLIENLWEEHGSGKPRLTHRRLFTRFLHGLDVDSQMIQNNPPLASTQESIDALMELCFEPNFIKSLGALGPGTEFFTNEEYSIIYKGLKNSKLCSERELYFWKAHISLDDEHYSEMISVLFPLIEDDKNRKDIYQGAKFAIDQEIKFWDGLEANLSIHN